MPRSKVARTVAGAEARRSDHGASKLAAYEEAAGGDVGRQLAGAFRAAS